ncbi:hypothetical protein NUW58_g2354 [Xylaria curta]|uniref:Uncharacterized protein n=1 Tax=Xylaria curta TaxID=42375 RepID=A0ACC1PFZ4_9PEZI|nr:hypothetical protein NUW58_g2354 [Xylaria curta]
MQTNPSLEDTSVTPTSSTGTNKRPRPPSSTSASVAPKRTRESASGEVDSEEETDNLLQSLQRPTPQSYPEVVPAPEPSAETPTTQIVEETESGREDTPQSILPTPNPFEVLATLEDNEGDDSSSFDTVLEDAPEIVNQPPTPTLLQLTSLEQGLQEGIQESQESQEPQEAQEAQEEPDSPAPQPLWPIEQTLDIIDRLCSPDRRRHRRDPSNTRFPIHTTSSTPSRFQSDDRMGDNQQEESLELVLYNPQGYDVVMANTPEIEHSEVTISNPPAWVIELHNQMLESHSALRSLATDVGLARIENADAIREQYTVIQRMYGAMTQMYRAGLEASEAQIAHFKREVEQSSSAFAQSIYGTIARFAASDEVRRQAIAKLEEVAQYHSHALQALQVEVLQGKGFQNNVENWAQTKERQITELLSREYANPEQVDRRTRRQMEDLRSYTADALNEIRHDTYGCLAKLRCDLLNIGNKVTNDIKVLVKTARLVGVHVSPTVIFNGVVANDISSGWTKEQWEEWLTKNIV